MSDDLVKRLYEHHEAMRGPDYYQAAARIEALETENARLREAAKGSLVIVNAAQAGRKAAESALASTKVELGETKLVLEQTERNAARVIAEAVGYLTDLASDMASHIAEQYRDTLDYPSQKRKYDRDMEPVEAARAFIQRHSEKGK